MEPSTSITLNTANVTPTPTISETDTHRNVRLAFGDVQENPILKLRNKILALSQNYQKWLLEALCLCVYLFVRMEQLGSNWTDFREIWYFSIFESRSKKIQFSLKSEKNTG